jgi:hypothetical protein
MRSNWWKRLDPFLFLTLYFGIEVVKIGLMVVDEV